MPRFKVHAKGHVMHMKLMPRTMQSYLFVMVCVFVSCQAIQSLFAFCHELCVQFWA